MPSTLLLGHSFLPRSPPDLPPRTLRSKAHSVEAQKSYFLLANSRHLGLCISVLVSQGLQRREAQDHGLWARRPSSVTKEAFEAASSEPTVQAVAGVPGGREGERT